MSISAYGLWKCTQKWTFGRAKRRPVSKVAYIWANCTQRWTFGRAKRRLNVHSCVQYDKVYAKMDVWTGPEVVEARTSEAPAKDGVWGRGCGDINESPRCRPRSQEPGTILVAQAKAPEARSNPCGSCDSQTISSSNEMHQKVELYIRRSSHMISHDKQQPTII